MRARTSASTVAATSSEKSRLVADNPRTVSFSVVPSLTAPTVRVMPKSVTILRAVPVAFSMSLEAPVVGSRKTSSSAARPPMA